MNKTFTALSILLVANFATLAQAPATLQLKFIGSGDKLTGTIHFHVNGVDILFTPGKAMIPGTNYGFASFTFKELVNPSTGEKWDVSEVELVHDRTGRKVTLPLGKTVDVPAPDEPAPPTK